MDKIRFIASRFDASTSWQLNDGRIIDIDSLNWNYGKPFNLETGEIDNKFYPRKKYKCKNGLPDYAPDGFTTLNNLKAQGNGHELHCYDEYNINLGEHPNMGDKDIDDIIAEFEDAGYKVSKAAILRNYYAWAADKKAGYRDEANGYHLFSPCGCNPFTLRATTLHPLCSDWQTTYEA
jgi:hypothetical protein